MSIIRTGPGLKLDKKLTWIENEEETIHIAPEELKISIKRKPPESHTIQNFFNLDSTRSMRIATTQEAPVRSITIQTATG